jgi:glycosyltransferase involved in cell wall biosynthesis
MPEASICIPVHNGAKTLKRTLDSVFSQTFTDFEVVVIDDHSTDETVEILQGYDDKRLTFAVNDEHQGKFTNWTQAVRATNGEYVKMVCADDAIAPTCLERQIATMQQPGNERVVLSAVRRTVIDDTGTVMMKGRGLAGMNGRVSGRDVIRKTVRSGTNPLGEPAAVLARGDAFRQCMPWDGTLDYVADVDMWTKVLTLGDLFAIPESLATLRISNNSWSGEKASEQRTQTVAFLKLLQSRHPHQISAGDVRIGIAQAALLAQGRRATYWYADRKK